MPRFGGLEHIGPAKLDAPGGAIVYVSLFWLNAAYLDISAAEATIRLRAGLSTLVPDESSLIPHVALIDMADRMEAALDPKGLIVYLYVGATEWPREAFIARGVFDGPGWQNKPETMEIHRYMRSLVDEAILVSLGRHEHH